MIFSRIETDNTIHNGLPHPMTTPSIRFNTISLSHNYVNNILTTTGLDMINQKNTDNCKNAEQFKRKQSQDSHHYKAHLQKYLINVNKP